MAASPRAMSGGLMHTDLCIAGRCQHVELKPTVHFVCDFVNKNEKAPRGCGAHVLAIADQLDDGADDHHNADDQIDWPKAGDQRHPAGLQADLVDESQSVNDEQDHDHPEEPDPKWNDPPWPARLFCLFRWSTTEGDHDLPMLRSHVLPAPDIDAEVTFGGV